MRHIVCPAPIPCPLAVSFTHTPAWQASLLSPEPTSLAPAFMLAASSAWRALPRRHHDLILSTFNTYSAIVSLVRLAPSTNCNLTPHSHTFTSFIMFHSFSLAWKILQCHICFMCSLVTIVWSSAQEHKLYEGRSWVCFIFDISQLARAVPGPQQDSVNICRMNELVKSFVNAGSCARKGTWWGARENSPCGAYPLAGEIQEAIALWGAVWLESVTETAHLVRAGESRRDSCKVRSHRT